MRVAVSSASATLALVFGFLPWTGCSQGGFYDTGRQQRQHPQSSSSNPGVATAQEPDPGQRASATAAADTQQQGVSTSQRLHEAVPDAAKELVRGILREDNRARTKQLVDDAWQTLE
ncbi:hypothetical protein COO60DRAFT_1637641 [Scenedesmus sp. NREL 46B-D3]|nr:hypothetical protein COO60DRAFT_1637641 [Scenedesmus sp. NREL 46B-D3]